MFTNYETMNCNICGVEFVGRRPSGDEHHKCSACIERYVTPILEDGDELPPEVLAEFENGYGHENRGAK